MVLLLRGSMRRVTSRKASAASAQEMFSKQRACCDENMVTRQGLPVAVQSVTFFSLGAIIKPWLGGRRAEQVDLWPIMWHLLARFPAGVAYLPARPSFPLTPLQLFGPPPCQPQTAPQTMIPSHDGQPQRSRPPRPSQWTAQCICVAAFAQLTETSRSPVIETPSPPAFPTARKDLSK